MTIKYCPKCKLDKEFGPNKKQSSGLQVWCKDCLRAYKKSHRAEKSIYNRQYRGKHSVSLKARLRKWHADNKEHLKQHYDQYFQTARGRAVKMISEIKRRCKNSGMPFAITKDDLIPRLEVGICQVTGMPLDFYGVAAPFSPSVDRIDSQRGYEPDNIRIVVLMFNLARRNWQDADVLTMANAFVSNSIKQADDWSI